MSTQPQRKTSRGCAIFIALILVGIVATLVVVFVHANNQDAKNNAPGGSTYDIFLNICINDQASPTSAFNSVQVRCALDPTPE